MAPPVLDTITPATGHTGGQTFVEISGSGFQLPTVLSGIPRPVPPPSLSVTFGGVPATDVRVLSSTKITCLSPRCPLLSADGRPTPGKVDVVVTHLNTDGSAVSGETDTLADAFEFVRPDLTTKSFPMWVLECLMRQFILQVVDRVDFAVHTDYRDPDSISYERIPEAPCLVFTDVSFVASPGREGAITEIALPGGRFLSVRAAAFRDCELSIAAIGSTVRETMNLMVSLDRFFAKNPVLVVPRSVDNADPSAGTIEFALESEPLQGLRITAGGSESNIKSCALMAAIRGIPIEDIPGLPTSGTEEVPDEVAAEGVRGSGYWVEEVELSIVKKES